ncbi:MAG: hypothetical protein JRF59_04900 [Deltaproteobacteria bacterium]|nr:hypothetical protein [Deltaproteobacteria bacterium]MBW2007755.1 hypothetical protein [Deltaproteobacteria bacterium]MBW2347165.1 hypothetical protein [Deltaproteobacteria bacterium]
MTLIAALEGKDGLILASDSRGTIGDPRGLTAINDVHKKIFSLSKYCGIATAGSAELNNQLIYSFTKRLEGEDVIGIEEIVQEFFKFSRSTFQEWFGEKPFVSHGQPIVDQRPTMTFILAGYGKRGNGNKKIYLLSSNLDFAPQLCTSGHMLAGVPQYATYLIHRFYNPEMKLPHIKSLAAFLIQETATQDPKVGGPIRMAQITVKNGYKELEEDEIMTIVTKNEDQNGKMKDFFFKKPAKKGKRK